MNYLEKVVELADKIKEDKEFKEIKDLFKNLDNFKENSEEYENNIEGIKDKLKDNSYFKKLITYDFKEEILKNEYNNIFLTNIFLYDNKKDKKDCDRIPLTYEIYKNLWNDFKLINYRNRLKDCKSNIIYDGDTMNSFTKIFQTLDNIKNNNEYKEWKKEKSITRTSRKNRAEYILTAMKEKNRKKYINLFSKHFSQFAKNTHTIGNFIPLPVDGKNSLNTRRNNSPLNDYWDIALECIKLYYYDKKENHLKNYIDNSTKCNKKWLDDFGKGKKGWKKFIEENYLQDFVEKDKNSNYKPIQFWDNHWKEINGELKICQLNQKWDGCEIAKNKDEEKVRKNIITTISNINKYIEARSKRMVIALIEKELNGKNVSKMIELTKEK